MPRVHSHYDNLKVARDAPSEVIRAAYRSLTLKYHPDRNTGNVDTARIMIILNAAYETLSDPARREEHDRWIAENEAADEPASRASPASAAAVRPARRAPGRLKRHLRGNWHRYGLIVLALTLALALANWLRGQRNAPVLNYRMLQAQPAGASVPEPVTASDALDSGAAGYIDGSRKLHIHSHPAISVDDSRDDPGVFSLSAALDGRASDPDPTRPQASSLAETPAYGDIQLDTLTLVQRKPK